MSPIKLNDLAIIGSELAFSWSDGLESYLDFETLRRACPCAACQGEPDVTGKVLMRNLTYREQSFQYLRHQLLGGYAIQIFWADGHSSGIYSYELLRSLGSSA